MEKNENLVKLNEFLDELYYQKGCSSHTIKAYKKDIEEYLKYINKDIVNIEKDEIIQYLKNIRENYKQNTILRKISSLKSFLKFLYINKMIDKDYSVYIEGMKRKNSIPEILKYEEIEQILESYDYTPKNRRMRLVILFLLATGGRISEIVNLNISDITDYDYEFVKVFGKGSKYRLIPIYTSLRYEIKDYLENYRTKLKDYDKTNKLFINLRRESVYLSLREHADIVGIEKKVYPHIIRHSVATFLLKNGADIRVVQEILGHVNISTTEIYTHVEKSQLKKEYSKIDFGGNN